MPALKHFLVSILGSIALLFPCTGWAADAVPDPVVTLLREVNQIAPEPYCCEITGEQPIRSLDADSDVEQRICECGTCQRWAFGVLQSLSSPFKHSLADKILPQIERLFLRASFDSFAYEQKRKQKAEELGVLQEWLEQRYGTYAVWPDRCALTGMPTEKSLYTSSDAIALCSCENCQHWAYNVLQTLNRRVVRSLASGKRDEALAALEGIVKKTRDSGRDARANTVYPEWYHQVSENALRRFSCDLTGKHPEKAVMDNGAGKKKKLCQCESCQRWASGTLRGLTGTVRRARHGVTDRTLQMLNAHIEMSNVDSGGAAMDQMAKAKQLGVLDEWIEYRYGKRALWPDRCAFTNLPCDKALTSRQQPLCKCDDCQHWAFNTVRELRVRVIAPLLARDEEKAIAALKEIAGEEQRPMRPRPPRPML